MRSFLLIFLFILLSGSGSILAQDDELELERLEQDRQQQMKNAVEADKATERVKAQAAQGFTDLINMDDRAITQLQKMIRESQVHTQHRDVVQGIIKSRIQGKPIEKFYQQFPVLLEISTDFLMSREAMTSLLEILKRRDDLKTFFYCWVGLVIFGFVFKRIFYPKDLTFFKKLGLNMVVNLILFMISWGIFYSFFGQEIDPSLQILAKNLFT